MRSWRLGQARHRAFLEDHAALGKGLLSLYQTDFNPRWYQGCIEQAEEILLHFTDPQGGFFDTGGDHETLIARPKSMQDSPMPSGNTLAVELLLRLSALSGERRYSEAAEAAIRAMQDIASRHPTSFAGWLSNLDFAIGPQLQLALMGQPEAQDFQSLAATIRGRFMPNLVIAGGLGSMDGDPQLLKGRQSIEGKATAYLCRSFSCNLPTTSPVELIEQLEAAP
ncbi:MAG TPA: thioredoxin domain-containing protein, partial [Anaerolineae bacterium]|nr:thioredoxin domain-containing protein [Anaerolineae bacterium]